MGSEKERALPSEGCPVIDHNKREKPRVCNAISVISRYIYLPSLYRQERVEREGGDYREEGKGLMEAHFFNGACAYSSQLSNAELLTPF